MAAGLFITETLSRNEFEQFQRFIFDRAGVSLPDSKQALVAARLAERLRALGFASYRQYLDYLLGGEDPAEVDVAVDRLTTHETSFFREEGHFEFLREQILARHERFLPFDAWSAACSSGEEVYSIAMECAGTLGDGPWTVLGSDVSEPIIRVAEKGLYPVARADRIPRPFLERYCLKGVRERAGTFLMSRYLRERSQFRVMNLVGEMPDLGKFDVIFLRNVLIYFQMEQKRLIVRRMMERLKPGGYLIVGHAESLSTMNLPLQQIQPSVYRQ